MLGNLKIMVNFDDDLAVKGTKSLNHVYIRCNARLIERENYKKDAEFDKWQATMKEEMFHKHQVADVLAKASPKIKFSKPRKELGDCSKLVKEEC